MKTPSHMLSLASLALATLSTTLSTTAASAAITSVSGATVFLGAAPINANYGALIGPPAYCWDEQTGVLTSGTNVNLTANGFYTGATPYFGVAAGTFASHMVHFDAS